jgi:hypothetical protein
MERHLFAPLGDGQDEREVGLAASTGTSRLAATSLSASERSVEKARQGQEVVKMRHRATLLRGEMRPAGRHGFHVSALYYII